MRSADVHECESRSRNRSTSRTRTRSIGIFRRVETGLARVAGASMGKGLEVDVEAAGGVAVLGGTKALLRPFSLNVHEFHILL